MRDERHDLPYRPRRASRYETVTLRGLATHLTRWGPPPQAPTSLICLLHGFLDAGESFQFLVDEFEKEWSVAALDWRGFGRSAWPQDDYHFADYVGDLDALLEQISPATRVCLVGHSMGGNVASLYAGVRPERVGCLINLEGLGLPRTHTQDAPKRMRKWLQQLQDPPKRKSYESFEHLAAIIRHRYPRFSAAAAAHTARTWGVPCAEGGVRLRADPRHERIYPTLYKREDAEAIWAGISAPQLILLGEKSEHASGLGADGTMDYLRTHFPTAEFATIPGAGHMMHIEKPELVARAVEAFLEAH